MSAKSSARTGLAATGPGGDWLGPRRGHPRGRRRERDGALAGPGGHGPARAAEPVQRGGAQRGPVGTRPRATQPHSLQARGHRQGLQDGRVERGGPAAQLDGGGPLGRVPAQRGSQQFRHRRGHPGQVRLAVHDPVEDRLVRPGAERRAPGRCEGHGGSPGVHIRERRAVLPLDHFRGQVTGRAHEHPGHGEPGRVQGLGDPEVDHDRVAVHQHYVPGLEVAVHHARRVDRGQGIRESRSHPDQPGPAQRPFLGHDLVQGPARHVPGHDVGRLAGHVGVEDLGHERATDPAHGLDLTGQPPSRVRVASHRRAQDLHRHRALLGITGEIDHAHAALADPVEQPVRAEPVWRVLCWCHRPPSLRTTLGLPHPDGTERWWQRLPQHGNRAGQS